MASDADEGPLFIPSNDSEREEWRTLVRDFGLRVVDTGLRLGLSREEIAHAVEVLGVQEMLDLADRYPDAVVKPRGRATKSAQRGAFKLDSQ